MFMLAAKIQSLSKPYIAKRITTSTNLTQPSKSLLYTANYFKLTNPIYKATLSDYLKNQKIDEARNLFDKIPTPSEFLYTKMIAGYTESYRLDDALQLFDKMPVKDSVAWNTILKGCLDCGNLDMGLRLFNSMSERTVVSWTTMMNGLFKSGKVEEAERLFYEMPVRDVAAWNAVVYGYFGNGRVEEAVKLFERMPVRNVISWTSMISGLDQHGKSDDALVIFHRMVSLGVEASSSTFASVITACASELALELGAQVHCRILKIGYLSDVYVTASLITFYANCGLINDSERIFSEKLLRNVVVWTSLLTGYSLNGRHEDALVVLRNMIRIGVRPNQSSLTSALNSCCEMEAGDMGKKIHGMAVKQGLDVDVFVGNSLVVLYSKCGNISDGVVIFDDIKEKNIVSWNSIIVGCAQHGCGKWALALFTQMLRAGIHPDDITFTGLLSACSHSGMLKKGRCLFEYLRHTSIEMKIEHYACMVDIFCRAGKIYEAEDLIKSMPMKANLSIWLALLNGCRMHSNLDVAENAAANIFYLDPDCSAAYILLSNIYASDGKWNDVARIRQKMKRKGTIKQPGCSWVNQKGERHTFVSGDTSHPLTEKIYDKLDWLRQKLQEYGYVPDKRFALHDVEDEQKEVILWSHSERLAICFALVSSPERSNITVMKNLRVCGDCHSAIKLIAKIIQREIVVRDSSRFHQFRDGFCSCGDYW